MSGNGAMAGITVSASELQDDTLQHILCGRSTLSSEDEEWHVRASACARKMTGLASESVVSEPRASRQGRNQAPAGGVTCRQG